MALHYVIFFSQNTNNSRSTKVFKKLNESSPQVHSLLWHFSQLVQPYFLPHSISPYHCSFKIKSDWEFLKTNIIIYFIIGIFYVLIDIEVQTKVYSHLLNYWGTTSTRYILKTQNQKLRIRPTAACLWFLFCCNNFYFQVIFIIILYWRWLIVSPSAFSCCHVLTSLASFIFSFFAFLNGSFFFKNSNAISVWTHITLQLLLFLLTIFYIQGAIKNNYF